MSHIHKQKNRFVEECGEMLEDRNKARIQLYKENATINKIMYEQMKSITRRV